jgi:CxxC motif-containing protein (DUF1111 family)
LRARSSAQDRIGHHGSEEDFSMTSRKMTGLRISVFASTLALAACSAAPESGESIGQSEDQLLGGQLSGISAATFNAARDNFAEAEGLTDGLGPIFNERACGNCHSNGQLGGAGENIERRYGTFDNVFAPGGFDPLGQFGGSLRQLFTVGNFNNPNFHGGPPNNPTLCQVPIEVEPGQATVHNVGRLTTPLFGLGLVDAMPDSFFDALAAAEPSATRGVVNRSAIVLPNAHDPSQSIGQMRVNRFGWKAAVPNLAQFAADAYVNEMGITTQHCSKGQTVTAFATESAPNGVPEPLGCDDLAPAVPANLVANHQVPAGTDDFVGQCAAGQSELQDDVNNFTLFMTFLAPPGPDAQDHADTVAINAGKPLFTSIGCANCHADASVSTGALATAANFRTPGSTPNGTPGNFSFHPYSDFLVHDMGSLGDNIGLNAGDSPAVSRRMRTAPLWGISVRNHLLHDGRTSDVATAIRAHAGQGAAAAAAFNALSSANQHNVVQFVRSL